MTDFGIAIAIIWFTGTLWAFISYILDSVEYGTGISIIEVLLAVFWLPISVYIGIVAFFKLLLIYLHVKKRR